MSVVGVYFPSTVVVPAVLLSIMSYLVSVLGTVSVVAESRVCKLIAGDP